jgi:hypothetical protein
LNVRLYGKELQESNIKNLNERRLEFLAFSLPMLEVSSSPKSAFSFIDFISHPSYTRRRKKKLVLRIEKLGVESERRKRFRHACFSACMWEGVGKLCENLFSLDTWKEINRDDSQDEKTA